MKTNLGLASLVSLGCAAFLAGCIGNQQSFPVASPTIPAAVRETVRPSTTAAASVTSAAAVTSTSAATHALSPTPVPLPTATPLPPSTAAQPPSPTATPVPTATNTRVPAATPGTAATRAVSGPVQLFAELKIGADDLAFSPDGSLLAVGSAGYEADAPQYAVEVWDLTTRRLRWSGGQAEWLRKVAFSPDGSRVGSAAFDGTARLWDTTTGAIVAEKKFGYWVYGLDFSAGGGWWATGAMDGKVVVADAGSGETVMEFNNDLMVIDLALAPNGPWIAVITSGSYGPMRVIVRDIGTFEERVLATLDGVGYGNVVFSPDTQWLAAPLGYVGEIVIWRTGTWEEITRFSTPAGVSQMIVSPDGRWLATLGGKRGADQKGQVVVWETSGWQQVSQFTLDDVGWDIAFSPDGRWLAVGLGQGSQQSAFNEGQLWDASSGKLVARMPHANQVLAVAFSADGTRIATGAHDAVKIWDMPLGE